MDAFAQTSTHSLLVERAIVTLNMDWTLPQQPAQLQGHEVVDMPCLQDCKALRVPQDASSEISRWDSEVESLQYSSYSKDLTPSLEIPSPNKRNCTQTTVAILRACIPDTRWTICLVGVLFAQLILCTIFETQMNRIAWSYGQSPAADKNDRYIHTILISQVITVIVEVCYQVILGLNAVRVRNIVHVIGICLNNIGILIFVILAGIGVEESAAAGAEQHDLRELRTYAGLLMAVLFISTLALALAAWRLSAQFAWAIYRHIATGDIQARRRYLLYEIYISLLHLDFFFVLGFWIQSRATMELAQAARFGLFVIIPATPFQLFFAGLSIRRENRFCSALTILLLLAQCAAILLCVIGMYTCRYVEVPPPARQRTLAYALVALPSLIASVLMTVVSLRNFGQGLKTHTRRVRIASDVVGSEAGRRRGRWSEETLVGISCEALEKPAPARMEID